MLFYRFKCFFVYFGKHLRNDKRAEDGRKMNNTDEPVFYTYILRCADGTYYTGYTPDLEKRLLTHNGGKGAKYTRSRLPVTLVYFEEYKDKSEAMAREYRIKKMSRKEKEKLIGASYGQNSEHAETRG